VVLLRHAVSETVASNSPNNRMQCFKVILLAGDQ
jgi:hypothetical protein